MPTIDRGAARPRLKRTTEDLEITTESKDISEESSPELDRADDDPDVLTV